VRREIRGAVGLMLSNQIEDLGLHAAVRRAERLLRTRAETGGEEFQEHYIKGPDRDKPLSSVEEVHEFISREDFNAAMHSLVQTEEATTTPHIFFDTTYNLDADARAAAVEPLLVAAKDAGVMAAGYIQVAAHGRAVIDSLGKTLYYPYTTAQFSVTVRDPNGMGSGWAGVDWNDWTRIDTTHLSVVALDKCVRSRNPVAVEPGRYLTILEPQAVCDLTQSIMSSLDRELAETGTGPFAAQYGRSKLGQRVMDERITISADPMDPDLGFPPFSQSGNVYHAATWVEHGILKNLAYFRPYGIRKLGINTGLPSSGAYRMSGGTTAVEEMIATTKRGLLVTRFSDLTVVDPMSLMTTGYTRDGIWLIENGKISKAVKNFRFTESPLFMLNNVEQLGTPIRVFHPNAPVIVPPIKARDFSFTSLSEAV